MRKTKSGWKLFTILVMIYVSFFILNCQSGPVTNDGSAGQEEKISIEIRLKELGIELPPADKPVANYVQAVRSGNLVFLSGHGPKKPDGEFMTGKVGKDVDINFGKEAARLTAINLLASLKAEIGDLNKVKRIIKVFGMVNADKSFTAHPQVINGCSDLLVSIFGERAKHARAAVGMNSLPMNITTEIEMIVEVME